MLRFIVLWISVTAICAHDYYQSLIPNGRSVPDPCGGGTWLAVGHYNALHHTHDKNPFGRDFASNGHSWTKTLCQKDSDGDGLTNGEELGDPFCEWTPGANPAEPATSHPGICFPLTCAESYSCGCHGHNCVGK